MLSRQTKRKFKAMWFYIASWIFGCVAFGAMTHFGQASFVDSKLFFFQLLSQFAIFMGLSHGFYDVLILQDDRDHRPLAPAILIRSMYFVWAILLNIALCVLVQNIYTEGELITEESLTEVKEFLRQPTTIVFIVYSFLFGYLTTFVRSVHKKFGSRVFLNTMLGKYQDPIEEDRVFMFVDLRQSTTLAEDLGHFTYSNFLRDYYHYISNCCEENHGEIYQIAGDGVYLTWPLKKCLRKPRPLYCFQDLKNCFAGLEQKFLKKYGKAPNFKAAAHCGKVICSEVGNFGSEMAYHGDAMNTTARLEAQCTPLGKDFIISEDLLKVLPKTERFKPESLGEMELRGRKKGIFAYSLTFTLDKRQRYF